MKKADLLDEIHIKPWLSYQYGQLFGVADNQKEKVPTRIQAFMISSTKSKNKHRTRNRGQGTLVRSISIMGG